MERLEVTLGTKADLEEVYKVFTSAIKKMEEQGIPQWDEIYPSKEILEDDIEKQELYIGKLNGEIAVVYVLNEESDEQYRNGNWQYPESFYEVIHRLCVNPKFQNQKLGYRVMVHIEGQLLQKGVETIRLDTFTQNPFSIRLYEKLGYQKVGMAYWRKGEFYLMEKKIEG